MRRVLAPSIIGIERALYVLVLLNKRLPRVCRSTTTTQPLSRIRPFSAMFVLLTLTKDEDRRFLVHYNKGWLHQSLKPFKNEHSYAH